MGDEFTDIKALMGTTGAPDVSVPEQFGGRDKTRDPQLDAQIKKQLTRSLQNKSELTPLGMNPKMKSSSFGADLGINLLNMFVPQVGTALQHHIRQSKEMQINQVVNDFTTLHAAWEQAQMISNGDENKAKEAFKQLPAVSAIFGDKKKMKLLSKAFGVDLMNPEKTQNNVAFQGLQRFLHLKQGEGKIKAVKAMQDQHKQQQQNQPQGQPNQGQPQGGQQYDSNKAADNFLNMWPKQVKEPAAGDVEKVAMSYKDLMSAMYGDEPKTEQQQWYRAKTKELGHAPSTTDIEAHDDAKRLKPIDQQVSDAFDLAQAGDMEGFKAKIDMIHDVAQATKPIAHKNIMDMIYGANAGNKDDQAAFKKYVGMQDERAMAYGRGRAMYYFQPYLMPDGSIQAMDGVTYRDALMKGEFGDNPPIPAGRLTTNQVISIEQLQTEAGTKGSKTYETGALKGVYDNIGAYDNAKDRAIFAYAFAHAEKDDKNWLATMHNILGQVTQDKLSPQGQQLFVSLQRLAETMGRFRSSMGLPSTDQSMALSLALIPGGSTPSAEYAKRQLDLLNTMIDQAYVPALGGKKNSTKPLTTEEKINKLKKALEQ